MNIRLGEVAKLTLKKCTFDGFTFGFNLKQINGQSLLNSHIDFSKVTVKGVLTRKNKQFTTFNENLLDMVRCHGAETRALILLTSGIKTIGADQKLQVIAMPIGGIINLKDDDVFELEIDCPIDMVDNTKCEPLNSYLTIEQNEAMGYEYATPYTKSFICPNGVGDFEKHLGDMVQKIVYLDSSIFSTDIFLSGTKTLDDVTLKSDKLNFSDKPWDCYARQFIKSDIADNVYKGDIVIFSNMDQPLNDVLLELDLVGANIEAGAQKVIYSYLYTDKRLLAKAAAQENIHAIENTEKSGVALSPEIVESKKALEKVKAANSTKTGTEV